MFGRESGLHIFQTCEEIPFDTKRPIRDQSMRFMYPVAIKKLHPDARIPTYGSAEAAGADLYARLDDDVTIQPNERAVITCGIALGLKEGLEGQVRSRSGLAAKFGIAVINSPGTIDSDYRGEVMVTLINHGEVPFVVKHHDRIAQLVVSPVARIMFCEVDELGETARGAGGIGSTGYRS